MLEESYIPTVGIQTKPLGVGSFPTHNNKLITKIKTVLRFLGPAFIVSVAYIDPGTFELVQFDDYLPNKGLRGRCL